VVSLSLSDFVAKLFGDRSSFYFLIFVVSLSLSDFVAKLFGDRVFGDW
jgi:hypothetical protein